NGSSNGDWLFGDYNRSTSSFEPMGYTVSGFAKLYSPSNSGTTNSVIYLNELSNLSFNDVFMSMSNTNLIGSPVILNTIESYDLDPTFRIGTGASGSVYDIFIDNESDKLYIGGSFD